MHIKGEEFIQEFIKVIKDKYPDLYINYDYDLESDWFEIWHNDFAIQFDDHEFLVFTGQMIKDILCRNNIYNFSFGYDYNKAMVKRGEIVRNIELNQKDLALELTTLVEKYNRLSKAIENTKANTEAECEIRIESIHERYYTRRILDNLGIHMPVSSDDESSNINIKII